MDHLQNPSHFQEKLLGPGRIILMLFRLINILALLAIAAASWILVIEFFIRGVPQWQPWLLWDLCSLWVVAFSAIFFIVSEVADFISPLHDYFAEVWPVLSDDHGFMWLGTAFLMMGFNVLSHLNNPVNQISSIGWPLWRSCISCGIISVVVGGINMILTAAYSFGGGLKARAVRSGRLNKPSMAISSPNHLSEKLYDLESDAGSMPQRPADIHPAYIWRTDSQSARSKMTVSPASSINHGSSFNRNNSHRSQRRYSAAAMSQFFGPAHQAASSVAGPYDEDERNTTLRPPPAGTYGRHPATRQQNFF
ncbi:hypothetical protein PspLS_01492 [Pyricularia sp. CBS 133598]|nr:hypothetical protein PspLS_01492 [Pyricularia sp. CBS 133598]